MKKLSLILLLLTLFNVNTAFSKGLIINSIDFNGRQTECLSKARVSMISANLLNISTNGNRVFADDAPYYFVIDCKAEKGIVFFAASGEDDAVRNSIFDRIWRRFQY